MPLLIYIREVSLHLSLRQGLTDIPSLRDEYSDEEDCEKCKCPYPSVGGIRRWLIQPSLVLLLISLSAPVHLQAFLDSREHIETIWDLLEWASTYVRSQPQKGFVLAPLNPSFLPISPLLPLSVFQKISKEGKMSANSNRGRRRKGVSGFRSFSGRICWTATTIYSCRVQKYQKERAVSRS